MFGLGLCVLAAYLLLAHSGLIGWLRGRSGARITVPVGLLVVINLVYGWGSNQLDPVGAVRLAIYLLLPLAAMLVARSTAGRDPQPRLLLFLTALLVWFPIEFGWVPELRFPPGGGIPLEVVSAVVLALYLFLVVRPVPRIGYTFRLGGKDLRATLVYFALFMALFAIPIGVTLGFVESSSAVRPFWQWPFVLAGTYFLVAVPEELLFRGILHNLIERTLPATRWLPLLISSVIFGLAHANNADPPILQFRLAAFTFQFAWVYVILATIAGLFYGLTYVKTRKITAAALAHCLVDSWWVIFFRG
jgi:membrane protease YdiL (CAAX protease family)